MEAGTYLATQALELVIKRTLLRDLMMRLENLRTEATQTSTYLAQATTILDGRREQDTSQEMSNSISTLVSEFTKARERLRQISIEIEKLEQEKLKSQEELFVLGTHSAMGYQDLLATANISVRREMGLPLNEDRYRKSIAASSDTILASLHKTIEEAKQLSDLIT